MSLPRQLATYRRLVAPDGPVQRWLEQLPTAVDARSEAVHSAAVSSAAVSSAAVSSAAVPSDLDADARALVDAAARHASLLTRELRRPALPAALARPDFVADLVRAEGARAAAVLGPALTSGLRPSHAPVELRRRDALDVCRERVIDAAEARLRRSAHGDLLASGLAPRTAPADADWAALALDEYERGTPADGSPTAIGSFSVGPLGRTPGWLWARIRGEVRGRILAMRRRRLVVRAALAAGLLVSALVVFAVASGRSGNTGEPRIVFQRVDQPLSAEFSTTAVVRRIRDGG